MTFARQADTPGPARVGVVAGKRVGGAVARNRTKRRLREILRRELPGMSAGWDLVCDAKPLAAEAPYATLAGELHALLTRAGLLAEPALGGVRTPETRLSSPSPAAGENRSKQE